MRIKIASALPLVACIALLAGCSGGSSSADGEQSMEDACAAIAALKDEVSGVVDSVDPTDTEAAAASVAEVTQIMKDADDVQNPQVRSAWLDLASGTEALLELAEDVQETDEPSDDVLDRLTKSQAQIEEASKQLEELCPEID